MSDGEAVAAGEGFPRNLMEFMERFATATACLEYVRAVRWPQGFVCPQCGGRDGWPTARGAVCCGGCRRQTSPTVGTILHNSRTDIRKWFMAVWLLCTQKTGVSAKTLQRDLKAGDKTAWLMAPKLRQATVRAERSLLSGTIEADETCVGGEETGVGGRQLVGKALVAIAVELEGKKVGRVRLRHAPDASGNSLAGFIGDCVEKGSTVHTDDWNGSNGVEAAGYSQRVTPIRGDSERALQFFSRVRLIASLLKRWLGAAHQGRVHKEPQQACLDEHAFRFNRRRSMHVGKIFHRPIEQAVVHKAKTYGQIVAAARSHSTEGDMQYPPIKLPRAALMGASRRRAFRRFLQSPMRHAAQRRRRPSADLSQRACRAQLAKQHRHKRIPASNPLRPSLRIRFPRGASKPAPIGQFQNLRKATRHARHLGASGFVFRGANRGDVIFRPHPTRFPEACSPQFSKNCFGQE